MLPLIQILPSGARQGCARGVEAVNECSSTLLGSILSLLFFSYSPGNYVCAFISLSLFFSHYPCVTCVGLLLFGAGLAFSLI